MHEYQFFLLQRDGAMPVIDFGVHADDGEAARAALTLLAQHASCCGVDVFQDGRLVMRHVRPDDPQLRGMALHGVR
jgi:hypothetical protein